MDRAGSDHSVQLMLKAKIEGMCHQEHGIIVQLIRNNQDMSEHGVEVTRCAVKSDGIHVTVLFSCITFKGKKWVR